MTLFRSSAFFLSILTGFLLWLSFPGGGEFWPLLGVALIPFLMAIRGTTVCRAFFCGLSAGIVHYGLLLYWIVIVVGKYGGLALYFSLPALLILALYMALYFGLFGLFAGYILRTFPISLCLWLLPVGWVGIDWLRGIFLTGLPWMDLGYGLYEVTHLIQIADLVGHHGVTFLIVFVNVLLLFFFSTRQTGRTAFFLILLPLCFLTGVGYYSTSRFEEINGELLGNKIDRMNIGIVQGNIDQNQKWTKSLQRATLEKYLSQTHKLLQSDAPSLVVWPETALPFYPPLNGYMQPLKAEIGAMDFTLLTGAPWYEILDSETKEVAYFNSAILLRPDGSYGGKYYKTHLVPFGEYIPFKKFLPFLAPLVEAVGDFSPGVIEQPLAWKQARAGMLICFESVFPELSRKWVLAGANVLVNLTNDAWYGKSSAPYHSLAMSVLRAVETRRSLVRSANTGISAFVTPAGTIMKRSELFVPWVGAAKVTLLKEKTVWVRFGYVFGPACLLLGMIGWLGAAMQRRWT